MEEFGFAAVTGLDIHPEQLARARRTNAGLLARAPERLGFAHGAAERMPFEDGRFDRLYSVEAIISSPRSSDDERTAAQRELRRQPRDASATRLRNRDAVDGRPRGHLRAFGLSRIRVRETAHAGELPGVTKSSW
ncbi:30S ribosomal protein S14 [Streptomyces sp. 900105755]